MLLLALTTVCAFLVQASTSSPSPAVGPAKPIQWYDVDLDAPPKERWTKIVEAHKDDALAVLDWLKDKIPAAILPLGEAVLDRVEDFWPLELRSEMQGIAEVLGVAPGDLLVMNLYYELDSGCTSIVGQHTNGTQFHGRNLDYGVPGLQKIAVNVRFTSKGQVQYYGTTYVGYIGLLTGMKPGAFSLSIDERDTKNGTVWDNAFEAIFKGGHSIGFFFRETLETTPDFATALERLKTTHMDSPSYLIIGGTRAGEGAVVTRERDVAVDVWMLNSTTPHFSFPFVVETNYDHWKPPPSDDNRRDPAVSRMNATDPSTLSDQSLLHVLSQFPNLNAETTYTVVMSASTGVYYGFTQNNNASVWVV